MTMKTKSIISAVLCAVLLGFTSCEKMLSTSSTIVMFEQDHQLDAATDTVYSVLGIIQKMQKIADRTVLLGEVRGDLVTLNDLASSDLKEISTFSVTGENSYNNPIDYYAVINNCNYFLANADLNLKMNNDYIFRKEYAVVLAYRAWTYLQLAQAYGKVPFVTVPIDNGADAVAEKYESLDIKQIAQELIPELESYVDMEMPNYGGIDTHDNSQLFFIPIRLILGDLCLWAGEGYYEKAAKYYHDYLCRVGQYKSTGYEHIWWGSNTWTYKSDSYNSLFGSQSALQQITYIPMEDEYWKGVTSELVDIFNSTENNQYYYKATASKALRKLSTSQTYCLYNGRDDVTTYLTEQEAMQLSELDRGDLRLSTILFLDNDIEDEKLSAVYNTSKQRINKFNATKICIYRLDLVYLRLAEALNYAGYPEAAFAVLKYGLADEWANYVNYDETYIGAYEKDMAKGKNIIDFPYLGANQGFYPYDDHTTTGNPSPASNTMGIHSRGCGHAHKDTTYVLHTFVPDDYAGIPDTTLIRLKKQQMDEVEQYLIDELALESAFEGNRFGDLIRFSMHRGERAEQKCYSDNAFLAERVAKRDTDGGYDEALRAKLTGTNPTEYNSAWYMPLP